MSTCCICGLTFTSRNSYGLCPKCISSDRLKAFDRVESAVRIARRNGIAPITLTVVEWLSVCSDHAGSCALCRKATATKILRFDRTKGLTYDNVVPACTACEEHHINGFDAALERVREYLDPQRQRKHIPQDEQRYKDETVVHLEYQ